MRRRALLLALLVLLCTACARPEEPESGESHLLYFLSPEDTAAGGDAITGVQVALDIPEGADVTAQATAVVEALLAGTEGYETPLRDVWLRGITVIGRRAYVDFSSSYAALTGIELSLADYCVTLSLTQLEGISAVTITAGGRELFYRDSAVLMGRDVLLSNMEDVLETVPVTLYFQNDQGELAAEQRLIQLYEGQTLAESLLDALLAGPEERGLLPVIPEGFVVNGIRVDEGVCYLSVPGKSLEALPETEEAQRMLLWSIGRSLYSIEAVDEICILADGELLEQFGLVSADLIRFRPEATAEG